MKKTLLFILCFSFCQLSIGQIDFKNVPKRTTKIIVHNSKTSLENYQLVLNALLDNDFEIEKRDSELFTIKTGFKPLKRTGNFYLSFRCKANSIEIKGYFNSGISVELYGVQSEDTLEEIVNRGMKGSVFKNAFIEMFNFSKLIGENFTFM